jgi:alcohol dehydrogenase, propanol-preferring
VGRGVTHLQEGDRVAVPWLHRACGMCEACTSGWETLCVHQDMTGYTVDGGYADFVKASAAYVGRIPDGVSFLDAAPLTCAGVTTYKAVKSSGARSSDLVAVFGAGGLGHLAIQYARITGASVVAVDVNAERLATARDLGAERVVHAAEQDAAAALQALGGADVAVATAVSPSAFESALGGLARGGRLICVGLPAENGMTVPILPTPRAWSSAWPATRATPPAPHTPPPPSSRARRGTRGRSRSARGPRGWCAAASAGCARDGTRRCGPRETAGRRSPRWCGPGR